MLGILLMLLTTDCTTLLCVHNNAQSASKTLLISIAIVVLTKNMFNSGQLLLRLHRNSGTDGDPRIRLRGHPWRRQGGHDHGHDPIQVLREVHGAHHTEEVGLQHGSHCLQWVKLIKLTFYTGTIGYNKNGASTVQVRLQHQLLICQFFSLPTSFSDPLPVGRIRVFCRGHDPRQGVQAYLFHGSKLR